jgi:hypothetical protein
MIRKSFVGKPPAKMPAPKEEKKNGKHFLRQKALRKAEAIFREAGRGFGHTGQDLQVYVKREMALVRPLIVST